MSTVISFDLQFAEHKWQCISSANKPRKPFVGMTKKPRSVWQSKQSWLHTLLQRCVSTSSMATAADYVVAQQNKGINNEYTHCIKSHCHGVQLCYMEVT